MPQKKTQQFLLKMWCFYSSLESCKIFGVLCSKICSQELSKIAQFGHTVQLSKESFITLTIGPDLISSFTGSLFSLHERRLSRRQKIIRPRFFWHRRQSGRFLLRSCCLSVRTWLHWSSLWIGWDIRIRTQYPLKLQLFAITDDGVNNAIFASLISDNYWL